MMSHTVGCANLLDCAVVAALVGRVAKHPLIVLEPHVAIGQRNFPNLGVMVNPKVGE